MDMSRSELYVDSGGHVLVMCKLVFTLYLFKHQILVFRPCSQVCDNIIHGEMTVSNWGGGGISMHKSDTVTPFKFAAIKVCGFDIMTYSRPFNFAVSLLSKLFHGFLHKCCVFLHKLK